MWVIKLSRGHLMTNTHAMKTSIENANLIITQNAIPTAVRVEN